MTELEEAIVAVVTNHIKKIYTDIPAKVVRYDAKKQQATLQPLIKIDGVKLNPIPAVPVQHIGGLGWTVAIQIDKGTEGIIKCCMRDIGTWLHNSKKQTNRKFSLTDTTFSPGYRSEEGAIPNLENNGIQLRSNDGKHYVWLKNDGDLYTSGNIHCKKSVRSDGESYAKGEVLSRISHTHPYIDSKGSSATPNESDTDAAEQS